MSETNSSSVPKVLGIIAVIAVVGALAVFMGMSGKGVAENGDDKGGAAVQAAEPGSLKLGDPVVAVVNGADIKRSVVFQFISTLPEQVRQMPVQQLFPLALEQVVNNELIGAQANEANLGADPEVEKLVTQAKEQIVRNVYIEREVESKVNQKKLLKEYEAFLDSLGKVQETKARHILLETEEKAREVVTKLDEGGDFETLAKEHSTGPSADRGGDLGWFAKEQMVPEFAEAAFSLSPGSYTKDPVKTQFGWHVIKAEDRRDRPEPQFETVKPQLEAKLRQDILRDLVDDWKKKAGVKVFDINGEEVKS